MFPPCASFFRSSESRPERAPAEPARAASTRRRARHDSNMRTQFVSDVDRLRADRPGSSPYGWHLTTMNPDGSGKRLLRRGAGTRIAYASCPPAVGDDDPDAVTGRQEDRLLQYRLPRAGRNLAPKAREARSIPAAPPRRAPPDAAHER
jgi:hypothetical protein